MSDAEEMSVPMQSMPTVSMPRRRTRSTPDPQFDEFWEIYPRKVGKGGAERTWHRVTRRADIPAIISGAKRFRDDCLARGVAAEYIPHAARWLTEQRWHDEPAASAPAALGTVQAPATINDEQLLAAIVRLSGDQERPITAAAEIIRLVRQDAPELDPEGWPVVADERCAELAVMPYDEYLQTPEWIARRQVMSRRFGYKCQVCYAGGLLNVHHRTYDRRGREHPTDLTVLCSDCHGQFHDKLPSQPERSDMAS